MDFSWSRYLSPSLALTLLQWGIPTEHKASLLTCNDLSLPSQLLTALIPSQTSAMCTKAGQGGRRRLCAHKLNLSLQTMLSHTCKAFKTVTCFKLYQIYIKEINFKKKTVNIGSGKVPSKPSIFTPPSFMEWVKTSILENALWALQNNRRKTFFFLNLSSPKSTMLITQTSWLTDMQNTLIQLPNFITSEVRNRRKFVSNDHSYSHIAVPYFQAAQIIENCMQYSQLLQVFDKRESELLV